MRLKRYTELHEAKIKDTLPEDYLKDIKGNRAGKYQGGPTRDNMRNVMRLLNQIMEAQSGNEERLTKIGIDIIMEHYARMLEDVELDIKIVDKFDEEKMEMSQKMQEEKEEEEPEMDSVEIPAEVDKNEIDRRKLINNIMQGEAQNVHSMIFSAKDEIDKITPELTNMYIEFLDLNRIFDWDTNRPDLAEMMKNMPEMANAMETEYPEEGEEENGKVKIKARVLDLPMLIHETVKGIYELMSAKAIPEDPVMAKNLLGLTDTLKDEEEDIKYGPYIAADIRDYIVDLLRRTTNDKTQQIQNLREFIFSGMMDLPANEFVELIKNMLSKNKADADKVLNGIVKQAISDVIGESEPEPEHNYNYNNKEPEDDILDMGNKEPEDDKLKPKTRDYSDLSKKEINDLVNDALDAGDFALVKTLGKYL